MDKVEERLTQLKMAVDEVSAPLDMDTRLRSALSDHTIPHRRRWIAAAVVMFLLFGYSWDALAYYGKKMLGYEQVAAGSAQDLFAQGRGQILGQSATFQDGVKITLDGVIMDGQGFTTLIKVEYPEGYVRQPGDIVHFDLDGIKDYARGGGTGEIKGNTEYWARTFDEEPILLEKRMKLIASRSGQGKWETIRIPFTLSRSEAYVPLVGERKIGKSIKTPYGDVYFDSLQASALSTVVKGRLKNAERFTPNQSQRSMHFTFDLMNGQTLLSPQQSGHSSKNDRDFTFDFKFAGIRELQDLRITNIRFEDYQELDRNIKLTSGMAPVRVRGAADEFSVLAVREETDNTVVIIQSKTDSEPVVGFFHNQAEITPEIKEQTAGGMLKRQYTVPGHDIDMMVKAIRTTDNINQNIEIE